MEAAQEQQQRTSHRHGSTRGLTPRGGLAERQEAARPQPVFCPWMQITGAVLSASAHLIVQLSKSSQRCAVMLHELNFLPRAAKLERHTVVHRGVVVERRQRGHDVQRVHDPILPPHQQLVQLHRIDTELTGPYV